MSILTALNQTKSFACLLTIAASSEEKLSFWGTRYLVVHGYEGTLSIDALALCLFVLAKNNVDFNEHDRGIGQQISEKITKLYASNESRLNNANFFTHILTVFKDYLSISSWNVRLYWDLKYGEMLFNLYTSNQFYNKFKRRPNVRPQWSSGAYSNRWLPIKT